MEKRDSSEMKPVPFRIVQPKKLNPPASSDARLHLPLPISVQLEKVIRERARCQISSAGSASAIRHSSKRADASSLRKTAASKVLSISTHR